MKLTRKKIRNIILQEMSNWSYKKAPDGRPRGGKVKGQNDGSWEAGEYIDTPERQEAERIKQLQADLNAKGLAQIQDTMSSLSLNGSWLPVLKQMMNQHGWITDTSFEDFTITFEGARGREYVLDLNQAQPDYEGRN